MSHKISVLNSVEGRRAAAAYVFALFLVACGGYGSGGYNGSVPSAPPPTVSLSVAPTSIVLGQSATLTWSSTDASSCAASDGFSGNEALNGSTIVTPTAVGSVTFTLSCNGIAAGIAAKSAILGVTAPTAFFNTNLVADAAGTAALSVDAHLVNPSGIAASATSATWVVNNRTATATQYDGNGKPQPLAAPLVVNLAAGTGGSAFNATGIVANGSGDFVIALADTSAAARFIFAGEGGMIAGWSPTVDKTHAVTMYTDPDGAAYEGLAVANNGTGSFLYATDFRGGKVDVFDTHFAKQRSSATVFSFVDPTLPTGFAPFGIQALKSGAAGATRVYVTYAKQTAPDNREQSNGAGLGLVDVFDTNGNFVAHLVADGGSLNAPWGLALAPADFGTLSNTLLVGNFGDGRINAFDANSGAVFGSVTDSDGNAFAEPGLKGIGFGNDAANQPHNTLFYSAGVNNQADGLFGRIDAGAAPSLNAAPVVTFNVPSGTLSGTISLSASVQNNVAIAKVEFFAAGNSIGIATTPPFTVQWDSTSVRNGDVPLNARATDVDGNIGVGVAEVSVDNVPVPN